MTILLALSVYLVAILIVTSVDYCLVRRFIPPLGFVFLLMYGVTYGLGLALWRLDPSSLFGYGSVSTVGALDFLLTNFALGILSLATAYAICRFFLIRLQKPLPQKTFIQLVWPHREILSALSYILIVLGVVALTCMSLLGLFARSADLQAQVLQSSLLAKLIVGTSIISRLVPVGFLLIPFAWKYWSIYNRGLICLLLSLWQIIAFTSGSRGLILGLPVYLLVGSLCWQKIAPRRLIIGILVGAVLFLPLAEHLRVHREGNQSIPDLKRSFETFQIGKQLMGTSHEFYLALSPSNCMHDLSRQLADDPKAAMILQKGVKSFSDETLERWHVVGLYDNCANRSLSLRRFEGFSRLPLGLIPSTFYPDSPSLFDGQELSQHLSQTLDLKPGEISHATISLFSDSWWRWSWPGLVFAPAFIGALLAGFQSLFSWMLSKNMLYGYYAQLLVVTLICTWINNTFLTMIWYLFWDFPKAWVELILLSIILSGLRLTVRPFRSS